MAVFKEKGGKRRRSTLKLYQIVIPTKLPLLIIIIIINNKKILINVAGSRS